MKTKTQFLAYVFCSLWDITIAWPAILLVRLFWGKNLRWETPPMPHPGGPVLVCDIRADSWPGRTWYKPWGGTTLGHGIFYGVDIIKPGEKWTSIQEHEHVHVEQFEGVSLGSFAMGLWVGITIAALGHGVAALIVGLLIWWLGYLVMGLGNWGAAWLRGEDPYRGSSHEESAYSQGDAHHHREGR